MRQSLLRGLKSFPNRDLSRQGLYYPFLHKKAPHPNRPGLIVHRSLKFRDRDSFSRHRERGRRLDRRRSNSGLKESIGGLGRRTRKEDSEGGLGRRRPDGGLRESKECTYTSDLQVFFLLVTVYSLWLTRTYLI